MPCFLADEAATEAFGQRLAAYALAHLPCVVHLHGDLGAGKTTLVRATLRALGVEGTVKSPTYTLLESYPLATADCHHLDLYRLADPEELDYIGLDALCGDNSLFLIEWPNMGGDRTPKADVQLHLHYKEEGRLLSLEDAHGRPLTL